MKSPFEIENKNTPIEDKIVVALERISEVFKLLLRNESKAHELSPIQTQILVFILFHSLEKCKVSYLAKEFSLTKATISDSVKVLLKKQLIKKTNDASDTRSFVLSLTKQGKSVAEKASLYAQPLEQPIDQLSAKQKEVMLDGLLKLINDLNKSGVITLQRMCFTCVNYQVKNGAHYCKLLDTKLADNEIRLDCPDYMPDKSKK